MERRGFKVAAAELGPLSTARAAGRRTLPARYGPDVWDVPFREALGSLLTPRAKILDVGAGRRPTVPPADRPDGVSYVGLDIDAAELALAEPGSYDEIVASPAEELVPALTDRFDLVLSFFTLEHVSSTERVLERIHSYLRPGGTALLQLAGARSPFSIANRLLPGRIARSLLSRTQGRDPGSVFPANYDHCTQGGLEGLLEDRWSSFDVRPLFTGAGYVLFSRVLTAAYVAYEDWAYRGGRADLAPYYLVTARR